jgi:hypothetical protein
VTTTEPGSASACARAAIFGASPKIRRSRTGTYSARTEHKSACPWFCQAMAGKLRSRIRWRQLRGHRLSASGSRRGRSPGQLTLSTRVPPFRLYTVVHSGGLIIHRDQVVTVERRTDSRNAAAKDMCTRWVRDAAERRVTSDWRLRPNCHGRRRNFGSAFQCQRQSIAFIRAIDRNSVLCGAGRARGAHGSRECTNNKTNGYCNGNYTLESARRRGAIARRRKTFELPVHLRTPLRRILGRPGQVLPLHVGQPQ